MLGSNVSTVGGLAQAFVQARAWDCEAIQIYTTPSRTWKVPPLADELICGFRTEWRSSPVKQILAHVPFLVNLAAPEAEVRSRSIDRLETELRRAHALGIGNVILHPGAATDGRRSHGIRRIVEGLAEVLTRTAGTGPSVLLENMAGQGTTIGGRFEELSEILDSMISHGYEDRLGVCFDTAHAFIAGYPLTGYEGYEEVICEFDEVVGIRRIRALHVNDALTAHGSRNDRHATIGGGRMGLGVFHAIVTDQRFRRYPKVLEVPDRDGDSLKALSRLRTLQVRSEPLLYDGPTAMQLRMPL